MDQNMAAGFLSVNTYSAAIASLKTRPKVQQRAWDFPFPIFHSSSYLVVPFVRQGKGPAIRGINFAPGC
jgi:hypothetical protein